jgi:hypothetical protein
VAGTVGAEERRVGDDVTAAVARAGRAFARFWLDFLVDDTPELFVVTLIVVAISFGLASSPRAVSVVVVPLLAFGAVVWSAARGRTRQS